MIERYSRKEIKNIWEDYNKYSIWLNIEIAAAEAMEKLKIIPRGVVRKVKSKAKINVNRISRTEYLNLSKKETKSTGDGRPVQFALIPGQVTTGGSSSSGRPENDMTLFLYPSPDKAYIFKYFYIGRIQDAGDYTNNADVPFYFLPCLTAGLAYYISLKKAPMLSANLKAVYDEEFERAADNDRERTSFRVEPAQAYIP